MKSRWEEGEGVIGFLKTTAPPSSPPQDVVAKRKPGGQPGNRNAWKKGLYNSEARALRKQVTDWKRQTRAVLTMVDEIVRARN